MKLNRSDIYADITRRLKEKLSQGTLPWRKSWEIGLPRNFQSKRIYNGLNFINLALNDYPSPYYLTFLQTKERGGFVRKGETGSWVVYWDVKEIPGASDEESRRVPFIRRSIVFNLSQTSLLTNLFVFTL
ncbi:MAG: ArdC family protein [Melioribacteraceae bacterium]|nr:ArdC family protein [Melioribacteraceae bacterium]